MQKVVTALLAIAIGIGGGYASAAYSLRSAAERGVPGNTHWKELDASEELGLLPYAAGRFLANGQLPPPVSVRQFFRRADEDGSTLRGDCAYVLEGKVPPARWWTVAATDSSLRSLNANTVAVAGQTFAAADTSMRIIFSPSPAPGNWIKVPDQTYQLVMTLHDPTDEQDTDLALPTVRKGRC
jgi:hypothetical protein